MPFYKFKLYGIIASNLEAMLFGDENLITLEKVEAHLEEAAGNDIEVDLSSVGGLVSVGTDIYFAFRDYKRKNPNAQMIANIKSEAASMMSLITSGEFWDIVTVEDISSWMNHNPSNYAEGDYRVMESNTDYLRRLANLYAGVYSARSGKSEREVKAMMDKTTFLYGKEIVEAGFADEVLETTTEKNRDSMLATMQLKYETTMEKIKQIKFKNEDIKKAAAKLEDIGTVMTVGTYDANIDIIEQDWSQSAADKRWRSHTDAEEEPNNKYAKAFLWYDGDKPELYGSYKLQVKDYVGGREVVNIRAVNNASARLGQTQGPTADEKTKIQGIIDKYQARWKKEQETNSLQPASGGENNLKEGRTMANTSTELRTENPALYDEVLKVGGDQAKADMIANNKAIMEFKNKDEYKNLSFVQERCEKALEDGENINDLKMSVQALMLDPKNQATIESPGDIDTGGADTVSGESSSDFEDEGL